MGFILIIALFIIIVRQLDNLESRRLCTLYTSLNCETRDILFDTRSRVSYRFISSVSYPRWVSR